VIGLEVLTIQGESILKTLLTGPLTLGVLLAVWLATIIYLALRRGNRIRRVMMALMAIIATILVIGVQVYSIRPGISYGIFINDHSIIVRFYMDDSVQYNLCSVELKVMDRGMALDMLRIRTNGVYDPTTGVAAGYYKTNSGGDAYVIITGKSVGKVLVIESGGDTVIVGMPGVLDAYERLSNIYGDACRG